jgi:hypothetical protein
MQHKFAVEAVNRSLQDLRDNQQPFGGVLVIFGGDFCQTLPVVRGGTLANQGNACVLSSFIWRNIRVFSLFDNLRLASVEDQVLRNANIQYTNWLLSGNGSLQDHYVQLIHLPHGTVESHVLEDVMSNKVIQFVYSNLRNQVSTLNKSDLAAYFSH